MTKTWAEIRQTYSNFNTSSADLMIALVVAIESSPLADQLFAWNAHSQLCIVQNPVEYPYEGPFLQITPTISGDLEFCYVASTDETKQWHRTATSEHAFAHLESFIQQMGW